MREHLTVNWTWDKGLSTITATFTIMKNCVKEEFADGTVCKLTFKEAKDLLLAIEDVFIGWDGTPDFWDTLCFRAKEWGNR